MQIEQKHKDLIGKVSGIMLLALIGVPVVAYAAANIFMPTSNLENLEANYKNANKLHEQSIIQEVLAAKNECSALQLLASAKLMAVNEGKLQGDKIDLANKASQECFIQAK